MRSLPSRTTLEETYSRKRFSRAISHSNPNLIILLHIRYCEAFPAIKGAIQRVQREKDRVEQKKDDKKSSKTEREKSTKTTRSTKGFTLQRRLSTATPVKYDMYVVIEPLLVLIPS